ncbi:histidine kinase sensor domain-containing protein [Photobacterium sp. SDRW27]|uniref:histidine kinase sensor domain-containing protein n=1 Tax=Photobacterium obscurum TaxID=2829490 RepID=UPI002242F636|nr:histidine kinase sensor domain-containing protein [Photobacterium obscurum]MCW8331711.1 histidine kinase sensor domain-containing protein [Photobacterium obscurum]
MIAIRLSRVRSLFFLGDRDGLAFRLFSYFAVILSLIMILQNIAEVALVKTLLHVPKKIQAEMLELADQAEVMIREGDMDELADWERGQHYYLFVLDKERHTISGRQMHPHFEFKLNFIRDLDTTFENQVNQPVIAIPLSTGHDLVIQFPHEYHPARYFPYYFMLIQVVIAILILSVFSLLLARYLQRPLNKLQDASYRLAEGDFSVRVSHEVGDSVTELGRLANSFDHMTQRIHGLAEKQKRLIRDVSHELRTPLARHNLALHLLRRRLPEESQPLLDRLERESDEMNELVTEILEYSQLENASYSVNLVPIQLETVCHHLILEMQGNLIHEQVFECDLNNSALMAMADNRLLLRVIKNLLGNAVKYAGRQAVISLSVCNANGWVQLVIEDNGAGIPEQHLNQIFDPFTRLEMARDKQSGGYGLGLAIVKESMSIMKGHVVASNRAEGGLRICLLFPMA